MTPQLRQAINLLQMSNLELNALIEDELASNPLLEREDDRLNGIETAEQTIDTYQETENPPSDESEETFSPDIDYENDFNDDFGSDREGYETTDYGWEDYSRHKNAINNPDPDYDYFEQRLKDEKSLYQFLSEQITVNFTSRQERIIAARLIEDLDESGYFRGNIADIAKQLKSEETTVRRILNKMKNFEPPGIFAENLKECIAIQLKDRNRLDCLMQEFLELLDLAAERRFAEIKKRLNIDEEDLSSLLEDIRSTNPKPAAGYNIGNAAYIIPDVFVRRSKNGYIVELNSMSLPKVLINQEYASAINQPSASNKETRKYLKNRLGSAAFLVKALHQRAQTILKVSEEIVRVQKDFFEKGVNSLKPLTLKDVAEAVEMHESTVSRVTSNKYMHTPLGIFELKYFFSTAAGNYNGDDSTSVTSIKYKIKNYIEKETADEILSDDKLSELLARESIKVARRTVAKYRESMNIPSSSERKKLKRSL